MANIFKKLFGFQDKKDTAYTGARPTSFYDSSTAQQLRDTLSQRAGGGGTGAETISGLGDAFGKYRERQFRNKELPALESAQGYANIASTPQGVQSIANRYGDIQSEVAVNKEQMQEKGEMLRQQAIENALRGQAGLTQQERGAEREQVGFDQWDVGQQRAIANAREKANRAALGTVVGTISPFVGDMINATNQGSVPSTTTGVGAGAGVQAGTNRGGLPGLISQVGNRLQQGGNNTSLQQALKLALALKTGGVA